uniref:Uncharacterized protein n=1 Tax=uncultured prokaryote TaxID=198431 RepID=A0A0H5Q426_9ZZZZ|nr:hypothetical protein [uncultured prokaryote]
MALVVPTGYALGSIHLTGADGTQPFVTTIGVNLSLYGDDYVGAANALFQAYATNIGPYTHEQWVVQKASIFIDTTAGSGSVDSDLPADPGTRTTQPQPIAMGLIARKNTAIFGRSGRGRMFLPGVLADGDVSPAGAIEPGSLPLLQAAVDAFYTDLANGIGTDEPLPPFLLHSDTSPAPAPYPITGLTLAPLVGWIRKRIR